MKNLGSETELVRRALTLVAAAVLALGGRRRERGGRGRPFVVVDLGALGSRQYTSRRA